MSATHILVVDDEPDLLTLYELTLSKSGHRVAAASDLAQARALLATQRFDALITDMRLPDGLGLELVRDCTGWISQHGHGVKFRPIRTLQRVTWRLPTYQGMTLCSRYAPISPMVSAFAMPQLVLLPIRA